MKYAHQSLTIKFHLDNEILVDKLNVVDFVWNEQELRKKEEIIKQI